MCEKYFDGQIPNFPKLPETSPIIDELREQKARAYMLFKKVDQHMQSLAFSDALSEIWIVIGDANKFIEDKAPWKLFKEKRLDELKYVIITLAELLKVIAQLIRPFMPATGQAIWDQLGLKTSIDKLHVQSMSWEYTMFGLKIAKGAPLFPKIETEKEK